MIQYVREKRKERVPYRRREDDAGSQMSLIRDLEETASLEFTSKDDTG